MSLHSHCQYRMSRGCRPPSGGRIKELSPICVGLTVGSSFAFVGSLRLRATLRVTFHDARKGAREMDLTAEEAERLLGGKARPVARRGRRPKAAATG